MNKQLIRNLLIILAISILITIVFSANFSGGNWNFIGLLQNILYGLTIGGSISLSGYITKFVIRRSNIQKYPSRTYVFVLITIFLYISIDVILVNLFWYKYTHGYEFSEVYTSAGIVLSTVITIFIGLTIFFIILSNNYMKRLVNAEKEIQHAKEEADLAKFETLKSQINPHFLFNSLNSLSSLIHVDVNKADEFTDRLSKIYRYILDHQDNEMVTLHDEIEFVKKYAYLQSIRFDDNFTIEFENIKDSNNSLIIPFSLQLLLENVFKHNIISEKHKVNISVAVDDNYVVISNDKTEKKKAEASHNVGLKNIISRYEFICDMKCIIEDTSESFIVKLPLISEN